MSARPSFFRRFYKVHVYAGLFVAAHFAILGLSGLLLLFKDELTGVPPPPPAHVPFDASAYERAWELARAEHPRDRPLAIFPDEKDPSVGQLRLGIDGERKFRGARKIRFDAVTGRALESRDRPETGFFPWLLALHRELFLGSTGKLYVGFVGLAYVFLLVSGAWIYGPFMRGRRFGEIPAAPPARRARDLHKFLGGLTFAWGLVVGLSGVFLAFNGVLLKLHQAQALSELRERHAANVAATGGAPTALAPLGAVIEAVRAARPEAGITYVAFPDTEFSIPGHFLVLANGTTPLTEKLSEMAVVDSATGRLIEMRTLPWYLKFTMLSEPLHFGDYGGLPLKLGWALFTLLSLGVAAMGVLAFARRRRGEPASPSPARSLGAPGLPRSPYRTPAALAVLTLSGILGALAADGALGAISAGAVGILAAGAGAQVLANLRRRTDASSRRAPHA